MWPLCWVYRFIRGALLPFRENEAAGKRPCPPGPQALRPLDRPRNRLSRPLSSRARSPGEQFWGGEQTRGPWTCALLARGPRVCCFNLHTEPASPRREWATSARSGRPRDHRPGTAAAAGGHKEEGRPAPHTHPRHTGFRVWCGSRGPSGAAGAASGPPACDGPASLPGASPATQRPAPCRSVRPFCAFASPTLGWPSSAEPLPRGLPGRSRSLSPHLSPTCPPVSPWVQASPPTPGQCSVDPRVAHGLAEARSPPSLWKEQINFAADQNLSAPRMDASKSSRVQEYF